jgi:hypothetical protein
MPEIDVSTGEYLDRLIIWRIKCSRVPDSAKLVNLALELASLEAKLPVVGLLDSVSEVMNELHLVNTMLWDAEDQIRECERLADFGERFVTISRSIYKLNDRRAILKRELSIRLGSGLIDEKSYTPY